MDKLMVALHNAINGNRVPSMNSASDLELVTRQKTAVAPQQQVPSLLQSNYRKTFTFTLFLYFLGRSSMDQVEKMLLQRSNLLRQEEEEIRS